MAMTKILTEKLIKKQQNKTRKSIIINCSFFLVFFSFEDIQTKKICRLANVFINKIIATPKMHAVRLQKQSAPAKTAILAKKIY